MFHISTETNIKGTSDMIDVNDQLIESVNEINKKHPLTFESIFKPMPSDIDMQLIQAYFLLGKEKSMCTSSIETYYPIFKEYVIRKIKRNEIETDVMYDIVNCINNNDLDKWQNIFDKFSKTQQICILCLDYDLFKLTIPNKKYHDMIIDSIIPHISTDVFRDYTNYYYLLVKHIAEDQIHIFVIALIDKYLKHHDSYIFPNLVFLAKCSDVLSKYLTDAKFLESLVSALTKCTDNDIKTKLYKLLMVLEPLAERKEMTYFIKNLFKNCIKNKDDELLSIIIKLFNIQPEPILFSKIFTPLHFATYYDSVNMRKLVEPFSDVAYFEKTKLLYGLCPITRNDYDDIKYKPKKYPQYDLTMKPASPNIFFYVGNKGDTAYIIHSKKVNGYFNSHCNYFSCKFSEETKHISLLYMEIDKTDLDGININDTATVPFKFIASSKSIYKDEIVYSGKIDKSVSLLGTDTKLLDLNIKIHIDKTNNFTITF
jgi:hypothetical protein